MEKEEAIKVIRKNYPHVSSSGSEFETALRALIPELKESEDERIRKELIEALKTSKTVGELKFRLPAPTREECLAYLEKQKDASKAIEAVERIDKYIDEHLANAHDMKDSDPDKKYYRGWDDALGKMAGILQDVYSGEKKKESLRDFIDDFPYSDQKEQKPVDLSEMMVHKEPYIAPVPTSMVADEQRPAEWSEEDKRIRKAILGFLNPDKGGTKYSLNAELVEWSDWLKSLPERFNLQPKNEWNEEDEKWINYFYSLLGLACEKDIHGLGQKAIDAKMWLKSLRPQLHWKPSEEQMNALEEVIVLLTNLRRNTVDRKNLEVLYEQLKKLM